MEVTSEKGSEATSNDEPNQPVVPIFVRSNDDEKDESVKAESTHLPLETNDSQRPETGNEESLTPTPTTAPKPTPTPTPTPTTAPKTEPTTETLSKNQLRKRKKQEYLAAKKARRKLQEKELKLAKALESGRDLEEERKKQLENERSGEGRKRREELWLQRIKNPDETFGVCMDCSFEDKMSDKEISSLAQQIRYCYATNRRSPNPCHFTVSSLSVERCRRTLEHLQNVAGFPEQWKLFEAEARDLKQLMAPMETPKPSPTTTSSAATATATATVTTETTTKTNPTPPTVTTQTVTTQTVTTQTVTTQTKATAKTKMVYLTSDADHVIQHLEDDTLYVIGGIVDRNRYRNLAKSRAEEMGVRTAKLPIEGYLKLGNGASQTLTCNHVFEILLKYREFGNHWGKAMKHVLPQRKDIQCILTEKKNKQTKEQEHKYEQEQENNKNDNNDNDDEKS